MIFAVLLALTGLTISAVAIYYSVIGLTAIFAAAFWPVVIMGVTLEAAKLVAATWLKAEWHRIPRLLKTYLTTAVIILMVITSMGIFGFLSKAHLDQNIVSGDVTDKVAIIDEKIKTQRDNIEAARKALRQLDETVDQTMARSTSEQGADKAANLRRVQQRERTQLQNDITKAQAEIAKLNNERAPIAKELRKVEAEVGPIKYIAKLIYGDNPDQNILEKAVTWVIIMIVIVFDPLAVLLLISAQMAYQWHRKEKKKETIISEQSLPEPEDPEYIHSPWPFPVNEKESEKDFKFLAEDKDLYPEGKTWEANKEDEANSVASENPPEIDVETSLASAEQKIIEEQKLTVDTTQKTADGASLYEQGKIEELPKELVERFDDQKLEEDSKKKISYMIKDHGQQVKKTREG